jgi:hypothetical protein
VATRRKHIARALNALVCFQEHLSNHELHHVRLYCHFQSSVKPASAHRSTCTDAVELLCDRFFCTEEQLPHVKRAVEHLYGKFCMLDLDFWPSVVLMSVSLQLHPWRGCLFFLDLSGMAPTRHNMWLHFLANISLALLWTHYANMELL